MTITGAIYFLGAWRPAYFEAAGIEECAAKMLCAVQKLEDRSLKMWLFNRIREGRAAMASDTFSAWSADHCDRGVSFAKRPHDPFLDGITSLLAPYPGLNYSGAVNHGWEPT
jgi:hypothetical protein